MRLGRSIHRTVNSDSSCLEVSVIMVYCAAFDCNVGLFPTEPTMLKKQTPSQ